MPTVTVPGANNSTVKLVYDSDANAVLAQYVAGVIQAGVTAGTIIPADTKNGPPPPVQTGKTGELVVSTMGTTFVPAKYDFIVDSAKTARVFANGDANQGVLVGAGDLQFFASAGSGSIIGGGGNNLISIAASDAGAWMIALGDGDNQVRALSAGNDTISLGSGHGAVQLGSGSTLLTTTGSDTVMAGSGSETISATGKHAKGVIYGNTSNLFFVAAAGATVFWRLGKRHGIWRPRTRPVRGRFRGQQLPAGRHRACDLVRRRRWRPALRRRPQVAGIARRVWQ